MAVKVFCPWLITPLLPNAIRLFAVSGTVLNLLSDGDRERLTGLLMLSVGVCVIFGHNGSLPVIFYFTTAFLLIFTTVLGAVVFDASQNFPLGTTDRMFKLLRCSSLWTNALNSSKPTQAPQIIEAGILRCIRK
ncbi:unnamed protein product [Dibothriocephalus latus]|uniref:Uncharacterized protein n=1 Tax=Dibothriocephalus latus TaxID=60516 RepID=A0A3P6P795_DIBLA|nr:unnamed protein product [Dibothriocephalus latus]